MSIATAIQNAQGKVANAYTAVSGKGGTLPATQDLSNLPAAINSISSGSVVIPKAKYVQVVASSTSDKGIVYPVLLVQGTSAPSSFNYKSVPATVLNKNGSVSIETLSSGTYTTWTGYATTLSAKMNGFALTATITL